MESSKSLETLVVIRDLPRHDPAVRARRIAPHTWKRHLRSASTGPRSHAADRRRCCDYPCPWRDNTRNLIAMIFTRRATVRTLIEIILTRSATVRTLIEIIRTLIGIIRTVIEIIRTLIGIIRIIIEIIRTLIGIIRTVIEIIRTLIGIIRTVIEIIRTLIGIIRIIIEIIRTVIATNSTRRGAFRRPYSGYGLRSTLDPHASAMPA
jgi:hypothetical protein